MLEECARVAESGAAGRERAERFLGAKNAHGKTALEVSLALKERRIMWRIIQVKNNIMIIKNTHICNVIKTCKSWSNLKG